MKRHNQLLVSPPSANNPYWQRSVAQLVDAIFLACAAGGDKLHSMYLPVGENTEQNYTRETLSLAILNKNINLKNVLFSTYGKHIAQTPSKFKLLELLLGAQNPKITASQMREHLLCLLLLEPATLFLDDDHSIFTQPGWSRLLTDSNEITPYLMNIFSHLLACFDTVDNLIISSLMFDWLYTHDRYLKAYYKEFLEAIVRNPHNQNMKILVTFLGCLAATETLRTDLILWLEEQPEIYDKLVALLLDVNKKENTWLNTLRYDVLIALATDGQKYVKNLITKIEAQSVHAEKLVANLCQDDDIGYDKAINSIDRFSNISQNKDKLLWRRIYWKTVNINNQISYTNKLLTMSLTKYSSIYAIPHFKAALEAKIPTENLMRTLSEHKGNIPTYPIMLYFLSAQDNNCVSEKEANVALATLQYNCSLETLNTALDYGFPENILLADFQLQIYLLNNIKKLEMHHDSDGYYALLFTKANEPFFKHCRNNLDDIRVDLMLTSHPLLFSRVFDPKNKNDFNFDLTGSKKNDTVAFIIKYLTIKMMWSLGIFEKNIAKYFFYRNNFKKMFFEQFKQDGFLENLPPEHKTTLMQVCKLYAKEHLVHFLSDPKILRKILTHTIFDLDIIQNDALVYGKEKLINLFDNLDAISLEDLNKLKRENARKLQTEKMINNPKHPLWTWQNDLCGHIARREQWIEFFYNLNVIYTQAYEYAYSRAPKKTLGTEIFEPLSADNNIENNLANHVCKKVHGLLTQYKEVIKQSASEELSTLLNTMDQAYESNKQDHKIVATYNLEYKLRYKIPDFS